MKDIKILAIVIGVVTDIFSTEVLVTKFVLFISIVDRMDGGQQTREFLLNPPLAIRLPEIVLGALGSFLGGFVTARMAKTTELKNTLLMGLLSDASAALFFPSIDPWELAICSVLTLAAATLGGYLSLVIRDEDDLSADSQK